MRNLEDYESLLLGFKEAGYEFGSFAVDPIPLYRALLLRHDVDFDIQKAVNMARMEARLGARSTYFFLLSSKSYNPADASSMSMLREIQSLGHDISLHFDPAVYPDPAEGLQFELRLFELLYRIRPQCVSLHRPSEFFLALDEPIQGTMHTYQGRFTRALKYVSDSGGTFKYGHPFSTDEFRRGRSIHLLIHPIWWDTDGSSAVEKLARLVEDRAESFSLHVAANCIPWRDHLAQHDVRKRR